MQENHAFPGISVGTHVFFSGRLSMAQCAGAGEMDKMDTVSNANRPTCPAFSARSIGIALPEA